MGAFAFTRWRLFFALTLLWALAAFTGQWRSLDGSAVGLLVVSGLIGIFIGDTALFACMNRLGPRRSGVIFATHALFSTLLAWVFLGETLWGWTLLGSALLVWGGAELGQGLEYWRGVLGLVIMAVMVLSPSGVLGGLQSWWLARRRSA